MPRANKKPPSRRLCAKIWVETDGVPSLTDAGVDLLEQIAVSGSLSEAARQLHFSYRRAWMLLDSMNKRWPSALVETAVGGAGGGGAKITELGNQVVRTYRELQIKIEHLLDISGDPFKPLK